MVRIAILLFGFLGTACSAAEVPRLAVLDIELTGDTGGTELVAEHQARIKQESELLRSELAGTQRYRILSEHPAEELIGRLKGQYRYLHDCNGCDLQVGQALGADQVLVSWVYRVSALILTLSYEIHDAQTGRILARESYDFRGDNDAAWTHAIRFMVRHLDSRSENRPP